MTQTETTKVVIPKEVAEAIETYRNMNCSSDLYQTAILNEDSHRPEGKVQKAASVIKSYVDEGNSEKYMNAVVNGYEVEKKKEGIEALIEQLEERQGEAHKRFREAEDFSTNEKIAYGERSAYRRAIRLAKQLNEQ